MRAPTRLLVKAARVGGRRRCVHTSRAWRAVAVPPGALMDSRGQLELTPGGAASFGGVDVSTDEWEAMMEREILNELENQPWQSAGEPDAVFGGYEDALGAEEMESTAYSYEEPSSLEVEVSGAFEDAEECRASEGSDEYEVVERAAGAAACKVTQLVDAASDGDLLTLLVTVVRTSDPPLARVVSECARMGLHDEAAVLLRVMGMLRQPLSDDATTAVRSSLRGSREPQGMLRSALDEAVRASGGRSAASAPPARAGVRDRCANTVMGRAAGVQAGDARAALRQMREANLRMDEDELNYVAESAANSGDLLLIADALVDLVLCGGRLQESVARAIRSSLTHAPTDSSTGAIADSIAAALRCWERGH